MHHTQNNSDPPVFEGRHTSLRRCFLFQKLYAWRRAAYLLLSAAGLPDAASYGGTGALDASWNASVFVQRCEFSGNTARVAAVMNLHQGVTAHVRDSRFTQNEAQYVGGVFVVLDHVTLNVVNCSLENNTASGMAEVGMVMDNSAVRMTGSVLDGNLSRGQGGVYVAGNKATLLLDESEVRNHQSGETLNTLFQVSGDGASLTLRRSVVRDNHCQLASAHSALVALDNVQVLSNQGLGFQVLGEGAEVRIHDSSFDGHHGPLLRAVSSATLLLSNSEITNATVPDNEALISVNQNSSCHVRHSVVTRTRANSYVMYISTNSSATFSSSLVVDNSVYVLYFITVLDNSTLSILDTSLSNNTIRHFGNRGLIFTSRGSHVSAQNSRFENNTAQRGGVLLLEDNSTVTVRNSSFRGNTAQQGAVLFCVGAGHVTLDACAFTRNTAYGMGGVVFSNGCVLRVRGSVMTRNTALLSGGCIDAAFNAMVVSTFSGSETLKSLKFHPPTKFSILPS